MGEKVRAKQSSLEHAKSFPGSAKKMRLGYPTPEQMDEAVRSVKPRSEGSE